jgi:ADP-ribose pyrophosphatase
MEHIERINRELMYKGSILTMYKDTIKTPDGNTAEWDFIEHHGAAAVVPVTDDGKILLVRQYRNSLDRYTLEIPAGGLNGEDEPTKTAAARELEEETGYASDNLEFLVSIVTAIAFCNEFIDIYVATNLKKTQQHLDEDEYIDVESYTQQEIKEMIYGGKIKDSKTVAAIMAYLNKQ